MAMRRVSVMLATVVVLGGLLVLGAFAQGAGTSTPSPTMSQDQSATAMTPTPSTGPMTPAPNTGTMTPAPSTGTMTPAPGMGATTYGSTGAPAATVSTMPGTMAGPSPMNGMGRMGEPVQPAYVALWRTTGTQHHLGGMIAAKDTYYPFGPGTTPGLEITVWASPSWMSGVPDWQLWEMPEYVTVHLGPAWFVEQQLGHLRVGEHIMVSGPYAMWEGQTVIIAQRAHTYGHTAELRNDYGGPMWAGGWSSWSQSPTMASVAGLYDPTTVQTANGRIERTWVSERDSRMGPTQMIAIRKADDTLLVIALAPSAFVTQNKIPLTVGDQVTVTGSLVNPGGEPILLASQLQEGGSQYALRDQSGNPLWSQTPTVASAAGLYNPNTVQTASGRLERAWTSQQAYGMAGTQMIAIRQADNSLLTVALAPTAFVSQNNIPLTIGDQVTVTGSLVNPGGGPLLLASQFQEANNQYALRDQSGNPLWSQTPTVASAASLYDPNTVQTVSGSIERTWISQQASGMAGTQMLALREADNSLLTVALAPAAFVTQNNIPLTIGDQVTVTGSLVNPGGGPMLLASQLQEAGTQYALRDESGNPLWAVATAAAPPATTSTDTMTASASPVLPEMNNSQPTAGSEPSTSDWSNY